jgi:hypothetical protein
VITNFLLIILGGLLAVVLWQMFRKPAASKARVAEIPQPTIPSGSAVDLGLARSGDVVSIHAAAEDFSDLDFTVDRRSAYESGPNRWIELSGEFRGRRVYVEVYPGRAAEIIGMLDGRTLATADVGTTEDELAAMDERQDTSAGLTWGGKRWRYESSREIGYFENEAGAGEGFYRWMFRSPDGQELLCIEKWEGDPFQVRFARRLNAHDVTVYRAA